MKLAKPSHTLPKPAVVTVLAAPDQRRHLPAQLVEADGRWMTLQLTEPLEAGSAIRVDVEGGLILGTAACSAVESDSISVRVEIDQVIPDTAGLARLVSAVLGQAPPVELRGRATDVVTNPIVAWQRPPSR